MKETIGNSHYQEKVSCLIEFVLPFLAGVLELQIRRCEATLTFNYPVIIGLFLIVSYQIIIYTCLRWVGDTVLR
mgnify:CR=1 FL=1